MTQRDNAFSPNTHEKAILCPNAFFICCEDMTNVSSKQMKYLIITLKIIYSESQHRIFNKLCSLNQQQFLNRTVAEGGAVNSQSCVPANSLLHHPAYTNSGTTYFHIEAAEIKMGIYRIHKAIIQTKVGK